MRVSSSISHEYVAQPYVVRRIMYVMPLTCCQTCQILLATLMSLGLWGCSMYFLHCEKELLACL